MLFTMFLQQARKQTFEDKDSEKTKDTVFYDVFCLSALSGAKTRVQKRA